MSGVSCPAGSWLRLLAQPALPQRHESVAPQGMLQPRSQLAKLFSWWQVPQPQDFTAA